MSAGLSNDGMLLGSLSLPVCAVQQFRGWPGNQGLPDYLGERVSSCIPRFPCDQTHPFNGDADLVLTTQYNSCVP